MPVGMRLYHLPDQFDVGWVGYFHDHDRVIARNPLPPEPRLTMTVEHQGRRIGAHRRVCIDQHAGQSLINLRIGLRSIDLAPDHLAMGPGQIEHTVCEMTVAILVDEANAVLAGEGQTGDHVDGDLLFPLQCDPASNGDDRIQHGTCAV